MGNELFSRYNIDKNSFLTGGHLNMWKIYHTTHKESKQPACLFVFEKKVLDQFPQSEHEEILTLLRKEATFLTQFNHPNILKIIEPLIENKYSLGFITEDFSFSMDTWLTISNPSKLEIKLFIKDVCKVISFLHNKCKMVHTNLNPDCIFICKESKVKLSGMHFTISDPQLSGEHVELTSFNNGKTNQNLNYASPELIYNSKVYYPSDIYSIGLLLLRCLNEKEFTKLSSNTPEAYKKALSNQIEHQINQMNLDLENYEILKKTLLKEGSKRPTIKELLQHEWFTDYKIKTISFIENLITNNITQNYNFLKCLPSSLKLFDNKIIANKVLPALLNGLKVEALINPILPAIFAICNLNDINLNFENVIWPQLKNVFQLEIIPAASLYLLLSKISFIGKNISNTEFSSHCLSLIFKSMDCGVSKIQSIIVDNMSFISNHIESQVLVNEIYSRMIQILYYTKSNTLKKKIWASLREMIALLDQNTINKRMIEDLDKIRKADLSYQLIQGQILIYKEIVNVIFINNVATKIIPGLIAMMTNGTISKTLFEKINEVLQLYIIKIKSSRDKDYCNDEEYYSNNSPKEKIEKEIIDQGKQLMMFFGVNDAETNHYSPSNNNNSTSAYSNGSELNGDGLHENNISHLFIPKIELTGSLNNNKDESSKNSNLTIKGNSNSIEKTTETENNNNKCNNKKGANVFENLLEEENEELSFDVLCNKKGHNKQILNDQLQSKQSKIEKQQKIEVISERSNDSTPQKSDTNGWNIEDKDKDDNNITNTYINDIIRKADKIKQVHTNEVKIKQSDLIIKETSLSSSTTKVQDSKKGMNKSNNSKIKEFTIDNLLDD